MPLFPVKVWLPALVIGYFWAPQPSAAQRTFNPCRSNFHIVQTEGQLQVRSHTHSAAAVIATAPNGTEVLMNISDRSGQWWEISLPDGTTGWAEAHRFAPSPLEARSFNGLMEIRTLSGSPVNLRRGPSLGDRVITLLPERTRVTPHDNLGYWSYVTTSTGLSGYVANPFLVCAATP